MTSKWAETAGTILGAAFMLLSVAWLADIATGHAYGFWRCYAGAWALATTVRVASQ